MSTGDRTTWKKIWGSPMSSKGPKRGGWRDIKLINMLKNFFRRAEVLDTMRIWIELGKNLYYCWYRSLCLSYMLRQLLSRCSDNRLFSTVLKSYLLVSGIVQRPLKHKNSINCSPSTYFFPLKNLSHFWKRKGNGN